MSHEVDKEKAKELDNVICFYELPTDLSQSSHIFLNVHYFCKFKGTDGREYNSCSHYYHFNKLLMIRALKEAEECFKILSGADIYKFTKQAETAYYNTPQWQEWLTKKDEVMRTANRLKYEQNPQLKDQLIMTGDKILIDDHPTDAYWYF